jgi:hypothetical protein
VNENDFEKVDRGNGVTTSRPIEFKDRMLEINMCSHCELLNAEIEGSECPIAIAIAGINKLATIYSPVLECAHFQFQNVGRPTIIQGPPPEIKEN